MSFRKMIHSIHSTKLNPHSNYYFFRSVNSFHRRFFLIYKKKTKFLTKKSIYEIYVNFRENYLKIIYYYRIVIPQAGLNRAFVLCQKLLLMMECIFHYHHLLISINNNRINIYEFNYGKPFFDFN